MATDFLLDAKIDGARIMNTQNEDVDWLNPWMPIESNEQRQALESELHRELTPGHQLVGLSVVALAMRRDQDDVLFQLQDGQVAVVHLTWKGGPEIDARWPVTACYSSLGEWIELAMKPDHLDFNS
ncbi:hypothetical protein [Bradyrhizobium sp. USDA 4454]